MMAAILLARACIALPCSPKLPPLHMPAVLPCAGAAHIGAMYTAFLSVAMACGTPGLMAALALGAIALLWLAALANWNLHAWRLPAAPPWLPSQLTCVFLSLPLLLLSPAGQLSHVKGPPLTCVIPSDPAPTSPLQASCPMSWAA